MSPHWHQAAFRGERRAEESGMKKRERVGGGGSSVVATECAAFLDGTLA